MFMVPYRLADKCVSLIYLKLNEFGLCLSADIVLCAYSLMVHYIVTWTLCLHRFSIFAFFELTC